MRVLQYSQKLYIQWNFNEVAESQNYEHYEISRNDVFNISYNIYQ